ncbi:MAG: protein-disulfide reductase DsbD domain-containing protein, partial [Candidatus Binatia bacterium]
MLAALVLMLAALTAPAAASAAAPPKVTLEMAPDGTSVARGGALGLEVFAVVARGWHINAHKPTESFLVPTVLTLTTSDGVIVDALNYPQPGKHTFAFAAGKELLVYAGKIGISTALHVPADFSADRVTVVASLRYQACDDETCLPPATVTAELEVSVGERAAAGETGVDAAPAAAAPD